MSHVTRLGGPVRAPGVAWVRAACLSIGLTTCLATCAAPPDRGDTRISQSTEAGSGVSVFSAPRSALESLPVWELRAASDWAETDATQDGGFYRVTGARRLGDGRVVVLNAGSGEVLLLDRSGGLVAKTGRIGDGPGEFRTLSGVAVIRGDSLVVGDRSLRRVTVLSGDLSSVRAVRLEGDLGTLDLIGVVDGEFLLVQDSKVRAPTGPTPEDNPTTVLMYDLNGRRVREVGTYPLRQWVRLDEQSIVTPTFSPITTFAANTDGLWVGTGRSYSVDLRDLHGKVVARTEWSGPDRTVTRSLETQWKDEQSHWAESADERRLVQDQLESTVFAHERAAYLRLIPVEGGGVWVEDYHPLETDSTTWLALDREGRPVARVRVGGSPHLTQVGGTHATGVVADEVGVPHVVVYGIDRPANSQEPA